MDVALSAIVVCEIALQAATSLRQGPITGHDREEAGERPPPQRTSSVQGGLSIATGLAVGHGLRAAPLLKGP